LNISRFIAFLSGRLYRVSINGQISGLSGTSASSPVVAGMISLANSLRVRLGKPTMGFVNPFLYTYSSFFTRDITSGNNFCTVNKCCSQGFYTAEGWDPVTGLGVLNVDAFVLKAIEIAFPPTSSPTSPSVFPSAVPSKAFSDAAHLVIPSSTPSADSTQTPSSAISDVPSKLPWVDPTAIPTLAPITSTHIPSSIPTFTPLAVPSSAPSSHPDRIPSSFPSDTSTVAPTTTRPNSLPSPTSTVFPAAVTISFPSDAPTITPLATSNVPPSAAPTHLPLTDPTIAPTLVWSFVPSYMPSFVPAISPIVLPSAGPGFLPSRSPTLVPSLAPVDLPIAHSHVPSASRNPTIRPSFLPSFTPTLPSTVTSLLSFNTTFHITGLNVNQLTAKDKFAIEKATSSSLGVEAEDVEFISATQKVTALGTGNRDKLLFISIETTPLEAIIITKIIQKITGSVTSSATIYSQLVQRLTDAVEVGNFTQTLKEIAIQLNATASQRAEAYSVVASSPFIINLNPTWTPSVLPSTSNSFANPSSDSSASLSVNMVVGIVVAGAVVVVTLIIGIFFYFCSSASKGRKIESVKVQSQYEVDNNEKSKEDFLVVDIYHNNITV
jgi:hypothetical protein